MLTQTLKSTTAAMAVVGLAMAPVSMAQAASHMKNSAQGEANFEAVQKAFARAADKVQQYGADQRQEALEAAREAIDVADAEMRRMENQLDRQWEQMSDAARHDAREAMRDMNARRFALARWYGGMAASTQDAWGDIKRGFARAFDDMENAMRNAQNEFQGNS